DSKNNNQINSKRNYLNINQLYKLVSISVKFATENYFSTNKNYKIKLFEIIYYLLEKDLKNIKQKKFDIISKIKLIPIFNYFYCINYMLNNNHNYEYDLKLM